MKRSESKEGRHKKHEEETGAREAGKHPEGRERPADELSSLKEKAAKAEEYYESLLRLKAEFENFKKRTRREKAEYLIHANQELILGLLPVIDSLELGIESARKNRDFDKLVEGLELTLNDLFQVLEKFGLRKVEAAGRKFDPNFHEAVRMIESEEHRDETVADEIRKGYLLYNKLLRPAMVTVARSRSRPFPGEAGGKGWAGEEKDEKKKG